MISLQLNLFGGEVEGLTLEDLFGAYFECRKHKRRTVNALKFELNFEQEVIKLWQDINAGTYKIGRSIAFIVKEPVQREIFAADFKDRIVHHAVIRKINEIFESAFILDSYSCRAGKGTLFGVTRVREMLAACSQGGTKDCYILRLDIKSFFMSINKPILYRLVKELVDESYHGADKEIINKLIKQIIFNRPEKNCCIKGKRSDWNGLPCSKSLFWARGTDGLPIGNLTSQTFANVYLNKLDQYVTKELGVAYYGRYVDDFVLIHEDKEFLKQARRKIEIFLKQELKLTLHPNKVYLQHASKGVRFIGAFIKHDHICIGKRTKANLYNKIYQFLPQMAQNLDVTLEMLPKFMSSINSYLGFMKHYNTYRLRSHILELLDSTFLSPAIELEPQAAKLKVNKLFQPLAQKEYALRRQRGYRYYHLKKKGKKHGYASRTADL